MNSKKQIKSDLIDQIEKSEDLNFLKALKTILDSSEDDIYQLTPEQVKTISISRTQLRNGEKFNTKAVIDESRKWLKKK
jgi:hypothetical protein